MEVLVPSEFDVIVLGSGLPESLIASAAAKGGKKVLLLDPDDSYGGSWSTRNLTRFLEVAKAGGRSEVGSDIPMSEVQPGNLSVTAASMSVSQCTHLLDPSEAEVLHSREYLIDSCPKVMFQGEPLVDILVKSKVHNYMDFRSLDASVIAHDGSLSAVPATKSDIFKSKRLSISEKRCLMQFLNNCFSALDSHKDSVEGFEADSSLATALGQAKLSPPLVDAISYGIALSDQREPEMTLSEGLKAMQLYMESYNKFGSPAAFMLPLYGAGALVEGFIRCSAVHAAVTVLRHPVSCLLVSGSGDKEGKSHICTGLRTENGQDLRCELLVANTNYLRPHLQAQSFRRTFVARALLLTSGTLLEGADCVGFVCPPGSVAANRTAIRCLQIGAGLQVAPRNRFLVYCLAMSSEREDPVEQLKPSLDALFNTQYLKEAGQAEGEQSMARQETAKETSREVGGQTEPGSASDDQGSQSASAHEPAGIGKPRVLHAVFFKQEVISRVDDSGLPANVVCCPSGDANMVGYTEMLAETERIFRCHFPDLVWWGDVELEPLQDVGLEDEEEDVLEDLMFAVGNLGSPEARTP